MASTKKVYFRRQYIGEHIFFWESRHCFQSNQHRNGGQNHDTCCRAAGRCHGYYNGCSAAAEAIKGSNESPLSPLSMEAIEGSNESPRSPLSICITRSVSEGHQGLSFGHFVSHCSNSLDSSSGRQSGQTKGLNGPPTPIACCVKQIKGFHLSPRSPPPRRYSRRSGEDNDRRRGNMCHGHVAIAVRASLEAVH